jgi:hypothetical protein
MRRRQWARLSEAVQSMAVLFRTTCKNIGLLEKMIRSGRGVAQRLARQLAMRTASRAFVSARAPIATAISRSVPVQARPATGARFATGPAASPTKISDDLLEKLGKLSTQVRILFTAFRTSSARAHSSVTSSPLSPLPLQDPSKNSLFRDSELALFHEKLNAKTPPLTSEPCTRP